MIPWDDKPPTATSLNVAMQDQYSRMKTAAYNLLRRLEERPDCVQVLDRYRLHDLLREFLVEWEAHRSKEIAYYHNLLMDLANTTPRPIFLAKPKGPADE